MKINKWFLLNLGCSFILLKGIATANVIMHLPEPVVIIATYPKLDFEAIMKSLMIDKYPYKVTYFIKKHLPMAVGEMQQTGIPASVTLAQLILETGYGTSELFREANNGFGIKEKIKGTSFYYKGEHYKRYEVIDNSFKDHSIHLLGKYKVDRLIHLKVKDSRLWTKMLTEIAYAEDGNYQAKIENIIDRYSFHKIDKTVWAASDSINQSW